MRNTLFELPALLCCMWGGALAGGLGFFISLPKIIWRRRAAGRRTPFLLRALFAVCDIITSLAVTAVFCAALIKANGGEPRLYAIAGFFLSMAGVVRLFKMLM